MSAMVGILITTILFVSIIVNGVFLYHFLLHYTDGLHVLLAAYSQAKKRSIRFV